MGCAHGMSGTNSSRHARQGQAAGRGLRTHCALHRAVAFPPGPLPITPCGSHRGQQARALLPGWCCHGPWLGRRCRVSTRVWPRPCLHAVHPTHGPGRGPAGTDQLLGHVCCVLGHESCRQLCFLQGTLGVLRGV